MLCEMGYLEKMKDHWTYLAAGVAATVAAKKFFSSKSVRNTAVKGMASAIKLQQDALYKYEVMKEEAQDIVAQAEEKAAADAE